MQRIAEQLDAVRRRGRALLVGRRAAQAVAVAAAALLVLGWLDFALRLPGPLRLIIGLIALGAAGAWCVSRLSRAAGFAPSLADLALRAERLFPQVRGVLATGLELNDPTGGVLRDHDAALTGALASASVRRAEHRAAGLDFGRMLDPRATRRASGWAALATAALALQVVASPQHAAIAAQRWLLPLGDASWPKRTEVQGRGPGAVVAADTPVDLEAFVGRGHRDGMRVWLHYRFDQGEAPATGPTAAAESVLMTPQVADTDLAPRYATQIDPPRAMQTRLQRGELTAATLTWWVEAGDHATDPQRVSVVARPTLTAATATLTPPAYAQPYQPVQRVELQIADERLATLSALAGSTVELDLRFNKPLPAAAAEPAALFSALPEGTRVDPGSTAEAIKLRFTLEASHDTVLQLVDEHGLRDVVDRRLRLVAVDDAPPTVTIFEPAADEAVLPGAVVPVRAEARDDVALETLVLDATHPVHRPDSEPTEATASLAAVTRRAAVLDAGATLEMAALNVRPGDVVTLNARARDVYERAGARHDPALAVPRKLSIIDAPTLMAQVRRELAAVRRSAERLRAEQSTLRNLEPADPADLADPQQRITRGLQPPGDRLGAVADRLGRNRLSEPELDALVARAAQLVRRAAEASDAARQGLQSPEPAAQRAARAQQRTVDETLAELTDLLDQGGDALGLRLEVAGLRAEQEAVALDTRELLPRTAGRPMESLDAAERAAVEALARRQNELAERAAELVRRMRSTAETLAQQGEADADRAAAEALAEAAATAQRQGLSQGMRQSSEDAQQNQLSQAGQKQMDALDTLERMLEQIGSQPQKRREMLRRRLVQLAEKLERLIAAQQAELDALVDAANDAAAVELAERQVAVWRRIIAVQTEAEQDPQTEPVAPVIGEAVSASAAAIAALRDVERRGAERAERDTVDALRRALDAVRNLQEQQQQDDAQRQLQQLRDAYRRLADEQDALRERTAPTALRERLTRRDRAVLRGLADEQAALGGRAGELREMVSGQVVFEHMHDRLDALLGRATAELRDSAAPVRVPADQARAAATLRAMAEALVPPPSDNDFQKSAAGGGGGGGGGGSGGGGDIVPPAAQLKLLRAEQALLLEETKMADALLGQAPAGDAAQEAVLELAGRQRELTTLAERLKEQMREQREGDPLERAIRPGVRPAEPAPPDPDPGAGE